VQNGFIYKITNIVNGKVYIGQTIYPVRERIARHVYSGRTGRAKNAISLAIAKYGRDAFKYETLAILPEDELDAAEIAYIAEYASIAPNGYNLKSGGARGRHSDATKRLISERNKGVNSVMYGKTQTEESNELRRERMRVVWADPDYLAKMKERKKGGRKPFTPEQRAHLSAVCMGRVPWNKGRKTSRSPESIEKQKATILAKKQAA
jgi:group I intron endonuclease